MDYIDLGLFCILYYVFNFMSRNFCAGADNKKYGGKKMLGNNDKQMDFLMQ